MEKVFKKTIYFGFWKFDGGREVEYLGCFDSAEACQVVLDEWDCPNLRAEETYYISVCATKRPKDEEWEVHFHGNNRFIPHRIKEKEIITEETFLLRKKILDTFTEDELNSLKLLNTALRMKNIELPEKWTIE